MGMSSPVGVLGMLLSGLLLAGCQTTAQTSIDGDGHGGAVQMARDAMRGPDFLNAAAGRNGRVQQIPPRIYLIRGLANVFSQGMDDLGAKLRQRGYNATVHEHGAWSTIAAEIIQNQRASGGRHQAIIIGHSLGANAVTDIANELARNGASVALAVAFDPTVQQQLAGGARRYVNLFQSNNGWGASIAPAPGYRGRLENVDLRQQGSLTHFNIDKDPRLHAQVIGWVGQAIGGGGGRPARSARHQAAR
jgi:alpha-beta hydrolase superfamily lysophospholipase